MFLIMIICFEVKKKRLVATAFLEKNLNLLTVEKFKSLYYIFIWLKLSDVYLMSEFVHVNMEFSATVVPMSEMGTGYRMNEPSDQT